MDVTPLPAPGSKRFPEKVVGNSYAPATVDDGKKAVAQNAAHEAVRHPYKVTIMKDFQTAPSAK